MAEALRLADELDDIHTTHVARNAAAELRRLHAKNTSLSAALAASCDEARDQLWESGGVAGCSRALSAEFQCAALLQILKHIEKEFRKHGRQDWPEAVMARKAIVAVEGKKT